MLLCFYSTDSMSREPDKVELCIEALILQGYTKVFAKIEALKKGQEIQEMPGGHGLFGSRQLGRGWRGVALRRAAAPPAVAQRQTAAQDH